jgi:putative transposase
VVLGAGLGEVGAFYCLGEGMREPFTQIYMHLVWATWDRAPWLDAGLLEAVDRAVRAECAEMRVEVIAFGGVADHVHLLVRMLPSRSISDLVKQVKGSTSHLISRRLAVSFKWQGGYGAFSVSRSAVPKVRAYILDQPRHHAEGTAHPWAEIPEE